jgi:hypothetical protein
VKRSRESGRPPHKRCSGGGGGGNPAETFDRTTEVDLGCDQVLEKYLAMARDAVTAGDRVAAENYFQHAEHYFRIINANGGDHGQNGRFRQGQRPDGQDQPIEAPIPGEGEQPQPADGRREVAGPGEEPYDPPEDPAGA